MNDEVMPYRKKAKKKTPKKFKHKHQFEPCVVEYIGKEFDRERGFIPTHAAAIRDCCLICGKIQYPEPDRWWEDTIYNRFLSKSETAEHMRELNPETRTLPTFHIDGEIWGLKFVDLNEVNSDESK